jgi:hypothetical protein
MVEAASTYDTLAEFYQTTQRNIPDDSRLRVKGLSVFGSHLIANDE